MFSMSNNYFFNTPEEDFDDPEITDEDYTKVYEPPFGGEDN